MSEDPDFEMEVVDNESLDSLNGGSESRLDREDSYPETEEKRETMPDADTFSSVHTRGEVPEEWTVRKLRSLLSYEVSGTWGDDPENGEGEPVLRATNFAPDSINLEDLALRQIPDSHRESKRLEKGDIVLERSGGSADQPTGRVLFFNLDGEFYPGNFLRLLRPDSSVVNRRLLYYCLDYRYRRGDTVPIQTNSTNIRNLQYTSYLNLDVRVPPLPEQRKIASVLYAVDQAIQKTEEIIEQEARIYEGTKRDLLRRGYFDHSGTQNTATGSYPDEWRIARGDEIFSLRSGEFLDSSKRIEDGEYPVYGGNGIMGYTDQSRVPGGTVVIGRVGAYCGNVHITESQAWVTDNAILVEDLSTGMKPGFLVHVLDEVGLNRFAEQSAQPRISQSTLRNLKIPIPPQEEQEKIVGSLSTIKEVTESEKELREVLRSLKKGLMQDLLTSKVRTADKAIEVLEEVQAHG